MKWDNIDITSNLFWTNILSLLKSNFLVSKIIKITSIWQYIALEFFYSVDIQGKKSHRIFFIFKPWSQIRP